MNGKDRKAIYHLAGAIDNLAEAIRDAASPQVSEELSLAVDRAQGMAENLEESGIVDPGPFDDNGEDTTDDNSSGDTSRE